MTRLALLAIFAFVYVVLLMAVNAIFLEAFILINANLVAIHAFTHGISDTHYTIKLKG